MEAMLSSSVKTKGNTVGSRSKTDLAYIAGFLDGDGSLMLQLKRRKDTKLGWRFMCTICLYQDTRHEEPLMWIRQVLGIGYISRRNDGMTELRINGFRQMHEILSDLSPYLRFKQRQAVILLAATELLSSTRLRDMTNEQLTTLADYMLAVQSHNYVTKKKKTREEVLFLLGLTP
jgi:LAGLIDADG endonuclease